MWFKKLRTSIMFSFIISIVVNIGMWFERLYYCYFFYRDYFSSWTMFSPTFVDIGFYWNNWFLLFIFCYILELSLLAQAEVKTILKATGDNFIKGEQQIKITS
jgi:molybdopterin-containing oxidoreductase family membrane subunit